EAIAGGRSGDFRRGHEAGRRSRRGAEGGVVPADREAAGGSGRAEKKVRAVALAERRRWIEAGGEGLRGGRQCGLARVSRSGLYYRWRGESEENLELMRWLDEEYRRTPFYGARRMTHRLRKQGYEVNVKRVRRLTRRLGLEAVYAKPRWSQPGPGH